MSVTWCYLAKDKIWCQTTSQMWSTYLTMVSHLVRKSKKCTQKLHEDPSAACEQVSVKGSQLRASYGSQMALYRSCSANIILPCMSDTGHSCRARVCKCHHVLIACSCHGAPHSKVFYLFSLSCSLFKGSEFLYVWHQQLKSGTAQEESLQFLWVKVAKRESQCVICLHSPLTPPAAHQQDLNWSS